MFIGTMALVVYLFYQYIAILVQEETGKTRLLDTAARMFLVVAEIGVNFLAYLTNIRMEQASYCYPRRYLLPRYRKDQAMEITGYLQKPLKSQKA